GIDENIIRVIPQACKAIIHNGSWQIPPIFDIIQKEGNVPEHDMHRTFNNGIGMVVVVPENAAQEVMDRLSAMDENAYFIGEIQERDNNEARTQYV
ncbi:MAG: AIR synthase-related protein, partial [Desulfobacterales bacterium]|nr:AIR synthase-related protein [Desulfobacterales bacterium]